MSLTTHAPTASQPFRLRLGSILLAMIVLASLAAALPLTNPTPAFADGQCQLCGDTGTGGGGDTGDQPDPNPNPWDPTGGEDDGGGGGSGGVVTPGTWLWGGRVWQPTNPPTPIGGGSFRGKLWSPDSKTYSYNAKCEGTAWTDPKGKRYGYLGTAWFLSGTATPPYIDEGSEDIVPDTYTATAGGYDCIDPPKYRIFAWDCILGANASYTGPMNNGESPVRPSKTHAFGYQKSDFNKGGKTSLTDCVKEERFDFNAERDEWPWGEYYLDAAAQIQTCDYYEWYTINVRTGQWNQNYLDCRGGAKSWVNPGRDLLESFCSAPFFHKPNNFDGNHSFSAADCRTNTPGSEEPGNWTCGPMPNPVFNGRTSPNGEFEVLDDAKDRLLKWDRPGISGGVKDIRSRTVKLALGNNVSPHRAGDTTNGDRQPYKVVPEVDEWKHNWQQAMPAGNDSETGWRMAFMAPGVPGKPWSVAPTWAFTADFLTKRISTVKVNPFTNQWQITLEDYWYTADASCAGNPADLNVYRARNSQGR